MKVVPEGLHKWEPRERTGVYLEHSTFHAGSVALILKTRTGHVSPHYHVVFNNKFYTVDHMNKGTVPVNCKNLVEERSYIAT